MTGYCPDCGNQDCVCREMVGNLPMLHGRHLTPEQLVDLSRRADEARAAKAAEIAARTRLPQVGTEVNTMKLPSPLRRLAWSLGGKAAARWFRDVAEGKKGERLKRLYWGLAGGKTYTGFGFGLVAAVALGLGEMEVAAGLAGVAVFLSGVGLVDSAWRTNIPATLKASPVYRFLAANSAELAMVVAAVSAMASACDVETAEMLARASLTCDGLTRGLLGFAAGLAWLGLYDSAGAAEPPKTPLEE